MRNLLWLTDASMQDGILCFQDGQEIKQTPIKIEANTLQQIQCDELVVFIPSNHLNSQHFSNDLKNAEKRLAVFISEFGHEILDSPNQLTFRYSEKDSCFYWLKTEVFKDLFAKLASLDMKIILLPDFFFITRGDSSAINVQDRLLVRLKNGEGYSLAISESDYLNKIFPEIDLSNLSFKKGSLTKLQSEQNFIELAKRHFDSATYDINFYNNSFSIHKLLFWLELPKKYALVMAGMLLSALLFLSIESWILQKNISNTIKDTESIFLEVNPRFTKLINARAQIDQIVGNSRANISPDIDLQFLSEFTQLISTLDISSLVYKPNSNQVSLSFSKISSFELDVITQAIKLKKFKLDTSNLTVDDMGNFSGEVNVFL